MISYVKPSISNSKYSKIKCFIDLIFISFTILFFPYKVIIYIFVYQDKCRNNISKLKNNKLSTTMILGRSRQDIRIMKEKFKVF